MPVNQPSNQIKLTNVAVVRLKRNGRHFEVACYKNKVQEWRTGVEKNLDEVLQSDLIFVNVSKGEVARSIDLKNIFGKLKDVEIAKEILAHGELQVGEKERVHELANLRKDIANRVRESVVDPTSQVLYSLGIIEKAMSEIGFSVDQSKNAKSQALSCIRQLQEKSSLPVQRARMRVRVKIPKGDLEKLEARIREGAAIVDGADVRDDVWESTLQIDPAQYRVYKELLDKECKGGRLEVVDQTVTVAPAVTG